MPCEPSATTLGERHARAPSVGRQMLLRPLCSKIPLLLRRIHRAGIHGSPANDDGRFQSLMSFALPISSPLRGPFRCSSSGLPKLHSSFEVAPTNELGEKIGPRRKGKGTGGMQSRCLSLVPLPSHAHDLGGGPRMSNFRDDARLGSIAAL